jgi:probable rRNA maturation factor
MIAVNIDPKYQDLDIEKHLKAAAQAALLHEGADGEAELTLVVTGERQIQKLNRQFRGENQPTDVLSFPADEADMETGQRYLGDVVISLPRATDQAKAAGHSLEDELQLLAVHGTLHLLGHDHGETEQRQAMWAAQDEILAELGLGIRSAQAEARPH